MIVCFQVALKILYIWFKYNNYLLRLLLLPLVLEFLLPPELGLSPELDLPPALGLALELDLPPALGLPPELDLPPALGLALELDLPPELGLLPELGLSPELGLLSEFVGLDFLTGACFIPKRDSGSTSRGSKPSITFRSSSLLMSSSIS